MGDSASNVWSAHQLAEFVARISEQTDQAGVLDRALDHLCETFDADCSAVVRSGHLLGATGFGVAGVDVQALAAVIDGSSDHICVPGAGACRALASPCHVEDDPCHLIVGRIAPTEYSPDERMLLRHMARVLAMSMQTFALVDSLRERQRLLERLSVIQRSIARRAGLQDVLEAIVAGVVELLDADAAIIRLLDPLESTQGSIAAAIGPSDEVLRYVESIPIHPSATERARAEGAIIIEPPESPVTPGLPDTSADMGTIMMAAPIHEAGTRMGVISVGVRKPERTSFTDGEREALALFAEHASIALNDARAVEAMEQAMHDPLTRLPNRLMFRDRLTAARTANETSRTFAVLFVDLDGFKAVNDTYGHSTGDQLLTDVALRLTWLVRPGDLVARHGGDEFTILLRGLTCTSEAESIAARILEGVRAPFTVAGAPAMIDASIGIAMHDEGDHTADLVERADRAMYAAKQRGRGRFELYSRAAMPRPSDPRTPAR